MKMEIIESDLKQLFQWIKNLDELCKSQNVLIETYQEELQSLEKRLIDIEIIMPHVVELLTQEDNK
jgi:hypothetical protein